MTATAYIARLEQRRLLIGMSMTALAKRSRVSLPTIKRILSGRHSTANFEAVLAISAALGLDVELKEEKNAYEFAKDGAIQKARRLVAAVQSTSGLEGQAVEAQKLDELVDSATHALMAGSRRKVWTD